MSSDNNRYPGLDGEPMEILAADRAYREYAKAWGEYQVARKRREEAFASRLDPARGPDGWALRAAKDAGDRYLRQSWLQRAVIRFMNWLAR